MRLRENNWSMHSEGSLGSLAKWDNLKLTYSIPFGFGCIDRNVGCGFSPRRVRGRRATLMTSPVKGSLFGLVVVLYHKLSCERGLSAVPPNSNAVATFL